MTEFGMWLTQCSPPGLTFKAILVRFSLYALEGVSNKHYLFSAGVTIWRGPSHQGGHKPMPLPPFIQIMAHYMVPIENVSICGLWEIKAIISCETWCSIQYFYFTWAQLCALHWVSLQPLDGSKGKNQAPGLANVFMVLQESLCYSREEHRGKCACREQRCLLMFNVFHMHICVKEMICDYVIYSD